MGTQELCEPWTKKNPCTPGQIPSPHCQPRDNNSYPSQQEPDSRTHPSAMFGSPSMQRLENPVFLGKSLLLRATFRKRPIPHYAFPTPEAKTSLFPRGWQYLALTLRLADVACASFLRTSLRTQPLSTVAISALGHSATAAFCKLRAQPLLWAQKGTRAEHAEDWQHSGRSGQGRQWQAPMQLRQPHLLHFLGEHSHCNALRTSWYTTEPLVQCRGTCMGSVRVGEQQEHWSCTSLMSMEYMALLAHLPCKKAEEDGSFTMVGSPGLGRALGQPAFSLTPPSEADLISPRSTQDS